MTRKQECELEDDDMERLYGNTIDLDARCVKCDAPVVIFEPCGLTASVPALTVDGDPLCDDCASDAAGR